MPGLVLYFFLLIKTISVTCIKLQNFYFLYMHTYTHTHIPSSTEEYTFLSLPCMVVGLSVKEIHYQDNALLCMLSKFFKNVFHYIYADVTWLAHNLPNVSICQGFFQSLRKMCLCVFWLFKAILFPLCICATRTARQSWLRKWECLDFHICICWRKYFGLFNQCTDSNMGINVSYMHLFSLVHQKWNVMQRKFIHAGVSIYIHTHAYIYTYKYLSISIYTYIY